ncbi:YhhN-like protein [Crepidotus variabilis]|uniref:YhhN-like protein n=1 Tax=Crepidotus variabilis TaxID=179855 RepID=A0A9P6E6U5_9AGAR|nr:YhhN-like protein [Crepidotus variabilis]
MSAFDFRDIARSVQLPNADLQFAIIACTGMLIVNEAIGAYSVSALFKLTASFLFVAAGLSGATGSKSYAYFLEPENRSSLCVLAGLVLSAISDFFLVPSKQAYRQGSNARLAHSKSTSYKRGIFLSIVARTAYAASFLSSINFSNVSFVLKASKSEFRSPDFVMTIGFGYLLINWLGFFEKERQFASWFEVPQELRSWLGGYLAVSVLMVATATATDKGLQRITGAWLLMLSDIFAAASVFGVEDGRTSESDEEWKPERAEWKTAAMGWIIYYGGQMVFAGCV